MTQKIILSGFGGQGILSAGLLIAESAVVEGWNATFFPSYGAEMRGGTANCSVILSDKEIASPIITMGDTLIAMNKPSLDKFLSKVKPDGLVIINSSVIKGDIDVGGRTLISLPFEGIALEKLGSPKSANVVLIGAFTKVTKSLKLENIKHAIEKKFADKGEKVVNLNYQALELGYQAI